MTISIDWGTKVIYVPKADLALLQSDPEIRALDLNAFHLWLKDAEDSEDGMPFLDTHNHNTEVELAGLTYARIVEITNGYTVEFEDGQYTISCTGANHNLSDVKVANQVSLIVNNAAGLITNAAIEYSSFDGAVCIHVASGNSGTVFPIGTPRAPVNNLTDALLIAQVRGFTVLKVIGNITLGASDNVDGFIIRGVTFDDTLITVVAGCSTDDTHFEDTTVVGDMTGAIGLKNAHIGVAGITGFVPGHIESTVFEGDLAVSGSGTLHILNSWSGVPGHGHPDIDMGGASGPSLGVRNWTGGIGVKNLTDTRDISIDMGSGHVHVMDTVTNGTFVVRGIAKLTDESSGSANIDSTNLINMLLYDLLGMSNENTMWSNMTFDANNLMTGCRITQYASSALSAVRKQWDVTATYDVNGEVTSYQMVEA